jgi:deoxyribodipyrimidine photo-lyase
VASTVVDDRRVTKRNDHEVGDGEYVLYWMQAAVRSAQNHALEYAIRCANAADLPLVVCFGVDRNYPESTPQTLQFLAEGLADVSSSLDRRGIGFVVRDDHPLEVARSLAASAAAVVVDRAYLREPRSWRTALAEAIGVALWEVETNLVVPVEAASDRREYAARTIRPKLHKLVDGFNVRLTPTSLKRDSPPLASLPTAEPAVLLDSIGETFDPGAPFKGGESQARAALRRFIESGLHRYAEGSSTDVSAASSSHLSKYLHYGHVSPIEVLHKVQRSNAPHESIDALFEELVVRRELAHNFVWFEPDYDRFSALPDWARKTLTDHRHDERGVVYTKTQLEDAQTADPYWNAAMLEMRRTGYLHNRMRMYWGKRIIEWTNTPEYAFRVALELNNRYLLDGRDPNSYASIGWLFGLHDQAFAERPILGKVRPMTAAGLERKVDTDAYVASVARRTGEEVHGAPAR